MTLFRISLAALALCPILLYDAWQTRETTLLREKLFKRTTTRTSK